MEIFGINDFGNFSRKLYNKQYVLLESEFDKLLLTRNKYARIVNGVRYNGIEAPLHKIMEYGEIYNNIYRNLRVKCGYKFNQKPSTYKLINPLSLIKYAKIEYHDKVGCEFRPMGLKCSI